MERRTEESPAEAGPAEKRPADGAGQAGRLPDGEALAAVCEAVESLLAQAPPPVARLQVRCGQVSVDLRWPAIPVTDRWSTPAPVSPAPSTAALADSANVLGESVLGEAASVLGEAAADPAVADLAYIKSPMVGTFYHASSPDTAPFIQVGDFVEAGQQVGVLEAMKLMNAVEAERPGRVVEILVADATGVEFDQALIAIAPLDSDRGE